MDCGLGFFAPSLLSRNFAEDCTTVSESEEFPMPIRYVEVLRSSSHSPADPADWALKRGVNAVILITCIWAGPGDPLSRYGWGLVRPEVSGKVSITFQCLWKRGLQPLV